MKYKVIYDDWTNKFRVVDSRLNLTDYVSFNNTFRSIEEANKFALTLEAFFIACWLNDKKMLLRMINRLVEEY